MPVTRRLAFAGLLLDIVAVPTARKQFALLYPGAYVNGFPPVPVPPVMHDGSENVTLGVAMLVYVPFALTTVTLFTPMSAVPAAPLPPVPVLLNATPGELE